MFAEYKHTISRMRSQAVGWSIGLVLYGLLLGSMYDAITAMKGIDELLKSYPQEMLAFFGGITEITTPWGYLDTEYFTFINLIIGIFAIGVCVNLIVGDEEKGLLDLVLAHPISRTRLYWGRLLAYLTMIVAILFISWLSLVIPSRAYGFDLTPIEFLRPFLSLFAISMFFSTLALLLSFVLPSTRFAGTLSGAMMVLNFLLIGLSGINPDLEPFMKFTPMHYYQGGYAINGLEWGWFFWLLIITFLFALLSWILFLKRDIRVSGEHNWRLPKISLMPRIKEEIARVEQLLKERTHKMKSHKKGQKEGAPNQKSENQKKPAWLVIGLVALAFTVIFCCISLVVIDIADQWCNLFAGIFNSISSGTCP